MTENNDFTPASSSTITHDEVRERVRRVLAQMMTGRIQDYRAPEAVLDAIGYDALVAERDRIQPVIDAHRLRRAAWARFREDERNHVRIAAHVQEVEDLTDVYDAAWEAFDALDGEHPQVFAEEEKS